jgi:hypothetical protein
MEGAMSPPVVASTSLARGISVLLPFLLLVIGVWLSIRAHNLRTSYAIMVCVSILVNPVAWIHYLVLSVIPLCVIGQGLLEHRFPKATTRCAVACGILLLISHQKWHELAVLFGSPIRTEMGIMVNPWILNGLTLLPTVLVLVQIWLLYRLDS